MENYLWGTLGIAASVILFLIGYRQTIGAKKERIISANSEIEKIILRRIVLENYTPSVVDLSRLLDSKARDFRVKVQELLSELQILNCIFTRIIETDLIAQNQREEILSRLTPVLSEAEKAPVDESVIIDLSSSNRKKVFYRMFFPFSIAVMASIMGGVVSIFPIVGSMDVDISQIKEVLLITMTMSMSIITVLVVVKRMKESQQDVDISSSSMAMEKAINFEREVAKIIDRFGFKYKPSGVRDRGYDFGLLVNDKIVLIEVKSWNRLMPIRIISDMLARLEHSVRVKKAEKGIIVTKVSLRYKNLQIEESNVQIMTTQEFRNYLAHNRKA